MSSPSVAWQPPETKRGAVVLTRAWRIVNYDVPAPQAPRLYVALAPDSLAEGYEALFPFLEERQLSHRHARSPQVLRTMEGLNGWTGKAVMIHLPDVPEIDDIIQEIDGILADRGLAGPPLLAGARPLGGRSGLLFLRRSHHPADEGGPKQWLAKLLGG